MGSILLELKKNIEHNAIHPSKLLKFATWVHKLIN
jgi:hypothetical protein